MPLFNAKKGLNQYSGLQTPKVGGDPIGFTSTLGVETNFSVDYTGVEIIKWTSTSSTDGVQVLTGTSVTFTSWATVESHVVTIEVLDPLNINGFIWNSKGLIRLDISMLNGIAGAVELNGNNFGDASDLMMPSNNNNLWTRLYLQNTFSAGTLNLRGLKAGMLPNRADNGHGLESILLPTSTRTLTGQLDWANLKLGVIDWSVMPNIIAGTSALEINGSNMIAAETNENLVILAATVLGKGPALATSVYIDGDNAAPDSSSGGFDGLQAVADLVTEGVVVFTS